MKPYPNITSYKQAVDEPASYATLEGVKISRKGRDLHFASGNFATVFKAEQQGRYYALKCFLTSREDREERYHAVDRYLKTINSSYFISYKYLPNELWVDDAEYAVVWMEWVEGQTLGAYLKDLCAKRDTSKIRAMAEKFKELALWLLDQKLAHGDLKHDNILVKSTGDLVLVDYDGMYVPTLHGRMSAEVGGKSYQHPQRSGKDYHPNLDDFSILVIYTTILALEQDPSLLEKYEAGNNLIVAHADLVKWTSSDIYRDLHRLGLALWADRLSEALLQPGIALPGLSGWLQQKMVTSNPTTLTFVLPGNIPLELVQVKAGSFMMGSPEYEEGRNDDEIQHQVILTRDYYIGKYLITQSQWQSVIGNNPSQFKGADRPVERVSWDDVQGFLDKVNRLLHPQGKFVLPTEAQWEYAARGGHKNRGYQIYAGGDNIDEVAWCSDNSGDETHPVGKKYPNVLGLYDMSGNVSEWCANWKGVYPTATTIDPVGPANGVLRVLRGGSPYIIPSYYCRSACRRYDPGDNRFNDYGFRIVFFPV